MKGKSLNKARRLFQTRRFPEVIRLLEPQVFRFRENFGFFFLLGTSCLYTGDYGGAFSYLQRAHQLNPDNIQSMLGLAAVHLKRHETQEALHLWLRIIDLEPGNRLAKKGLNFLRKHTDREELVLLLDSVRMRRFFPSSGFYIPPPVYAAVLVVLLVIGGFFSIPILLRMADGRRSPERPGILASDFTLPEGTSLYEQSGPYRYILTEKEIRDSLEKAVELFHGYQDNHVRREVNRILHSNASTAVKEKAKILMEHLAEPSFTDMKDSFSYQDIKQDPLLYEYCFIRWKGRVTNVKTLPDVITFDFLVGYESGTVLEGTVPAFMSFPTDLKTEYPIEILGQVQVKDNVVSLRVTSLHQLMQ